MRKQLITTIATASLLLASTAQATVTRSADAIPHKRHAPACPLGICNSKLTLAEQQQLTGIVNDFQSQMNELSIKQKNLLDNYNSIKAQIKSAKGNPNLQAQLKAQLKQVGNEVRENGKLMRSTYKNATNKLNSLSKQVSKEVKTGINTKADVTSLKTVEQALSNTLKSAFKGIALSSSSVTLTNGLLLSIGVAGATGAVLTSISPK